MTQQLQFSGMPEPIVSAFTPRDRRDDWIHELLNNPKASPVDLLNAYVNVNLDARLRDSLMWHASLTTGDLYMALDLWTGTLRDRALSVVKDTAVLRQWGESAVARNRAIVAMNPACPRDLVYRLSEDRHASVRGSSAASPNLPRIRRVDIARRDLDPNVREFAYWLLTTTDGRAVAAGERYMAMRNQHEANSSTPFRMITYGLGDHSEPPV